MSSTEPEVALSVSGVRKSFAGTVALRDFDMALRRGEIHALVGGNGSGKSTLIKILAGIHQADAGEISRSGRTVSLDGHSPADAKEMDLRFVHQDLGIVPILSAADNLAIGGQYPTGALARIKGRKLRSDARETLERFHVDVEPTTPAGQLSTPQQAMLAIARALQTLDPSQLGVLVLDEPTASLPAGEADLLLDSIRRLADQGHTILLVTHRLDEVKRAADRVTGIRDGVRAGTLDTSEMTESDAVKLILGRHLENSWLPRDLIHEEQPLLSVRELRGGPIARLSLDVRPGEVVGVAGLLGSGRTELLEMIFGARSPESGSVLLDGAPVDPTPRRMRDLGVAFVPEDRKVAALFPDSSIAENITAGRMRRYFSGGLIRNRKVIRAVNGDIDRFHVKTASATAKIETLSGGNQQKVVLARWLRDSPRLILLDEPTQGIDVGAREEIFGLIGAATEAGAAVVLVSSEFEELCRLSHRIIVLSGGEVTAELSSGGNAHEVMESVISNARSLEP
jgi:ribose transport system ATP-binding protein